MNATNQTVEWIVLTQSGEPVDALDLASAMVIDLEYLPRFAHKPHIAPGRVTLPVADEPFAVCLPAPVEEFGNVYLYADNAGMGYTPADLGAGPMNFAFEAAVSRMAAVLRAEQRYHRTGTIFSASYRRRMNRARALIEDARLVRPDHVLCARAAMRSLAESLHAGEQLVLENARLVLAKAPPRRNFLFGCNGFGYQRLGEAYAERFRDIFNYVTLPFYRRNVEHVEGVRSYAHAEGILKWAERDGLTTKGHPLLWQNHAGFPDWLRGRNFDQVRTAHRDYIRDTVARFKDRIRIWDVINEGHDWANDPRHTLDQMVELTRMACDTTREADPSAVRVVNSCCTWSEYAPRQECSAGDLGRFGRPVLHYLRDILAAGVDFEVVGIQMYYPYRDLFEIDRHLEQFCELGKPVHITELGVSSDVCWRNRPKEDIRMPIRRWHGKPWSEGEQADWIEGYYTIAYSKPAIHGISWWDFSEPAWYPHGALCHEDLSPKEGYRRLRRLIRSWRD